MAIPPKLYQFLVCCFASIGSFAYGYDLSVIAQVLASESFTERFNPSVNERGAIVSLFTGGAFFGALLAGYLGDQVGRKYTISIACIIFIVGGVLQAACVNLAMILAGRFIAGVAVGTLTMIIPLFQAELCHPSIRGTVTALQQFFLGIGALCASWIAYGCYVGLAGSENQFRVPLGLQVVPVGLLLLATHFLPESPRWLIAKDKRDKAYQILANLHAHGNKDDPETRVQYYQIVEEVELENSKAKIKWLDLFKSKDRSRRIILCMAIQASVQLTGVSAIQYYSPTIFSNIGLSTSRTLLFQSINSIIALIAQALCIATIDFTGRRWVLIISNIGCGCMFIIGAILLALFPAETNNNRGAQIGFIGSTWIYNFIFSYGVGPLSWIIPAESFNLAIRSKGVAIATMTSFAFNTMIGQVTDKAMAQVGWKYYLLFVVCGFSNAIFFWAFLPESRRIPLEFLDTYWNEAPYFIPGWKNKPDYTHILQDEVEELDLKANIEHKEEQSENEE